MTIPKGEPDQPIQGGENPLRWSWVNAKVWTKPMLDALERGVKGGVWYTLIDKVFRLSTLETAAWQVLANKGAAGIDRDTVEAFEAQIDTRLARLSRELQYEDYEPQAIRRVYIPKLGSNEQRPLGIPTVTDRIAQAAIVQVIEPIFEKEFAEHSYGFRPNRGCKDALRRVDYLLKNGYEYIVDVDIKGYFDTIPHERLLERLKDRVADKRLLKLIEKFLKVGIAGEEEQDEPEEGVPQGGVLSPLLSNIYLNPLDHLMVEQKREMVRYADDFVILCQSRAEAETAMDQIQKWCEVEGLTIHPEKSRVVTIEEGFDFLGYHFQKSKKTGEVNRWPREKSVKKLRESLRAETKRTNGTSLEMVISRVNRKLRGWYEYFKHSRESSLKAIDGWLRMRLRSMLKRRKGGRGRARSIENQEWPNRFFEGVGLFSLVTTRTLEKRSV